MALDDAPSVEVDIKDAGTSAPADVGADVSAPVAESSPAAEIPAAETPVTDTPVADTPTAEPAREGDGNKDINLDVIKANAEPKINDGLVGAAQQAQEERAEQREAKKEEEKKELEAAADNAREARDGRRRAAEEEKQRKEWEGKTHQMGNLEMSGVDLDKLLQFMKSPAAIAKVEAAMKAKGSSQKQIDKAQKEWKEYQELKEKEKSGQPLSPQEMKRLQEINKSQEFQQFSQTATEVARNNGISLSSNKTAETQAAQAAVNQEAKSETRDMEVVNKDNDQTKVTEKSNAFSDLTSQSLASERFASAPQLTKNFTASATIPSAQKQIPEVANDATMVAQSNATTPQVRAKTVVDVSFG